MFNRSFVFITYSLVIAFVCFYLVHSLFLGISDDEAYYWILAQKPSLGFAFHPPLVTWMIALSQKIFSFILPINSVFILRFFSVFCSTFIFALALYWMKIAGVEVRNLWKGALVFLSFAGWSSLCWLMVPDSGLFLGWMLLFVSTWMLCFNTPSTICFVMLVFGSCISLLSKYSGVLSIFSAGFCMFFWCSKENKKKAFLWLGIGTAVAMIPIWIWNHNNNWVSVLYQIQGRHSGTKADFIRYLRFWLVEIFCAGPVLIYYFFGLLTRIKNNSPFSRYFSIWVFPVALVFCIQPLWSDFKIHWAFVVWLPVILELALKYSKSKAFGFWIKFQCVYGLLLSAVIIFLCHFPLLPLVYEKCTGKTLNPLLDVTNDFYGWSELKNFLKEKNLENEIILGSRYQTVSQAAFALGKISGIAQIPRDIKQKSEWDELGVTSDIGPEWPMLKQSVLYVADNRYNEPPRYTNASCFVLTNFYYRRSVYLAKTITIWKCKDL